MRKVKIYEIELSLKGIITAYKPRKILFVKTIMCAATWKPLVKMSGKQ